jgi:hypothetical protein
MIDNRTPGENLDITINDIQNGILADDSLHIRYFDPREVVVLKVCPPFSPERSPLTITSDAKSYPRHHRRPREVPAQCTPGPDCQLPNRFTIYLTMDRYPIGVCFG